MAVTTATSRWTLTADALDHLLDALDADRERAAVAYEQLRMRIARLFGWWGATNGDELADETLDRVARKLAAGAVIRDGSFAAYVRSVARLVYYERRRRRPAPLYEYQLTIVHDGTDARLRERLDLALSLLAPRDRRLALEYYGDGKAADVRRALASELRLSPAALRLRAHRIRERLEQLMRACSEREPER